MLPTFSQKDLLQMVTSLISFIRFSGKSFKSYSPSICIKNYLLIFSQRDNLKKTVHIFKYLKFKKP